MSRPRSIILGPPPQDPQPRLTPAEIVATVKKNRPRRARRTVARRQVMKEILGE